MRHFKPGLLVPIFFMICFWALTPVAIAYVKINFSLPFQIWIRYCASCIVLWSVILFNKNLRESLSKNKTALKNYLRKAFITALCTLSFQLLYTYCFFLIQPTFGILLYQSQALFSLLLGALIIKEERRYLQSGKTIIGLLLTVAGATTVILFSSSGIKVSLNLGILMAVLAAFSWALVGLTNRLWLTHYFHPVINVTIVFSIVSLMLTPAAFVAAPPVSGNPNILKWIILIGSGLLGVAGGQGLFYYILPRIGLIPAALVQLLVPFITGIFSYLILGELMNIIQIFGGICLLSGCAVIIAQKAK